MPPEQPFDHRCRQGPCDGLLHGSSIRGRMHRAGPRHRCQVSLTTGLGSQGSVMLGFSVRPSVGDDQPRYGRPASCPASTQALKLRGRAVVFVSRRRAGSWGSSRLTQWTPSPVSLDPKMPTPRWLVPSTSNDGGSFRPAAQAARESSLTGRPGAPRPSQGPPWCCRRSQVGSRLSSRLTEQNTGGLAGGMTGGSRTS